MINIQKPLVGNFMRLESERRQYLYARLTRESLLDTPAEQFNGWMNAAIEAKIQDPTAMSLSTISEDGTPWQRIVLLKGFDKGELIFYTNLSSRKSTEMANNPNVSVLFPWLQMDRQVILSGLVERLSTLQSTKYFLSRPRESQLAAWSSAQSRTISSRQILDAQFQSMKAKFSNGEIPTPDFWGGFKIVPTQWEFWQGGENRLHDRFRYDLVAGGWKIQRLAP